MPGIDHHPERRRSILPPMRGGHRCGLRQIPERRLRGPVMGDELGRLDPFQHQMQVRRLARPLLGRDKLHRPVQLSDKARPARPEGAPADFAQHPLLRVILWIGSRKIHLAEIDHKPRRGVEQKGPKRHRLAQPQRHLGHEGRGLGNAGARGLKPGQRRKLRGLGVGRGGKRQNCREDEGKTCHACSVFRHYSASTPARESPAQRLAMKRVSRSSPSSMSAVARA